MFSFKVQQSHDLGDEVLKERGGPAQNAVDPRSRGQQGEQIIVRVFLNWDMQRLGAMF